MKRIRIIFCLLATLLVSACETKPTTDAARLSGEIKGLGNDTILVCGMDRLFDRIDTLTVKADRFADTLSVDTLTGLWLIFSDGTECPFFAERREQITFQGSADALDALTVTGNTTNDELTAFRQEVAALDAPTARELRSKAEDFIRSHPASPVSAYLLETYFLRQPNPDYNRIERLAEPLTGEVKDRPGMVALLNVLEEQEKLKDGRTLPFFQTFDADGKKLTRNDFKDQYLLIHFWASWDAASRRANADLRPLYEAQKKKKKARKKDDSDKQLALMGISLDLDKAAWQEAVKHDTLEWAQGCELRGWDSEAVQKLYVTSLPFNILVNPKGRILGTNLTADEVEKEIK
ncbi:MAG: AhpC/TSA family protein [Candidatus Bacteroides intestinipullorum]|uniref:AhpC/TSA family protein n=1 Tax=Candidatus Bacteroides intestinipullorum TaxID=2838471 RepID=A0A9E2NPM7_9BACE|nr:AhpC/TSA family protein [Candidatus Bacteroides intestinipullorum]